MRGNRLSNTFPSVSAPCQAPSHFQALAEAGTPARTQFPTCPPSLLGVLPAGSQFSAFIPGPPPRVSLRSPHCSCGIIIWLSIEWDVNSRTTEPVLVWLPPKQTLRQAFVAQVSQGGLGGAQEQGAAKGRCVSKAVTVGS